MNNRVRCCPSDCALKSDWQQELQGERELFEGENYRKTSAIIRLLGHPLRQKIILMLLKRDHCVCEFFYVFEEPQNLISYNLKKLKEGGLIESYYRSNHKIYKVMAGAEPALIRILGDLIR